ncbi:MAG: anhydro-N-acetylmuramic acid kinase [Bacteroidales bacterium]|nr:anhydro-N-acetylmuramic acid kinase [Bacteroidales bacterium]MBN2748616.1 anhydro-N-acetylmuramic acid kinase [Bacteroidales bacterium]
MRESLFNLIAQPPSTIRAVGIMSGTSLDGLDLCLSDFRYENSKWDFAIVKATTLPYSPEIKRSLTEAFSLTGAELCALDFEYGKWIGERINEFVADVNPKPNIIGSHGHTIFHQPSLGYTTQIGKGAAISAVTGIPCVSDFRSGDVARGGQGAPLVPIGDRLLFSSYNWCLNIGGIANISTQKDSQQLAWDICPANMILNALANKQGKPYDSNGDLGREGAILTNLLDKLNSLPYYQSTPPKSLGREWFETHFYPLFVSDDSSISNLLATTYEHISHQIAQSIPSNASGKLLVTGGGAHNDFLIEKIKEKANISIVVPNKQTVDFKEALVFAFLSVLYIKGEAGSLSSVTGATASSIAGVLSL